MKISVALCTYNGAVFIKQQIDSILNQTIKVDEIIVCDDISSDNTIQIIKDYNIVHNDIFKIYINENNLGSVKNFEKAISLCTGDIIFLSDQDDIWHLNKVATYIDYFNNNPKINVLASNGYCIDDEGSVIEKYSIWDVPQFLKDANKSFDYYTIITFVANIATGASMAFRKKLVSQIFPIPQIEGFHHDEWIAMVASKENSFELLNEKYLYYRIHENQQVGGVFHDKTNKTRKNLIKLFNLNLKDNTIKSYKKLLRKVCLSYAKNKNIYSKTQNSNEYLRENLVYIENHYNQLKNDMRKNYPVIGFLIQVSDRILGKRQLNK